jgi:antitoxin (DNA-binding transcriptional repressor) of toxin-antitoxin stability system
MGQWTLHDAKTKLSQVVDEARADVPQSLTRRDASLDSEPKLLVLS